MDDCVPVTLRVDPSERGSTLLTLVETSGAFEVQMQRLRIGDYLVADAVVVERKTHADFATSVVDGRLFRQAAALAHGPHRPLMLIEGPTPPRMPAVHRHALKGAVISLAVMWRLPVLYARDPEESLLVLRMLSHQVRCDGECGLRRYDYKPKRFASRQLYVLQGLPGVGPALSQRMLKHLGSVERVMTADETTLAGVRGLGPKKARGIRELVTRS